MACESSVDFFETNGALGNSYCLHQVSQSLPFQQTHPLAPAGSNAGLPFWPSEMPVATDDRAEDQSPVGALGCCSLEALSPQSALDSQNSSCLCAKMSQGIEAGCSHGSWKLGSVAPGAPPPAPAPALPHSLPYSDSLLVPTEEATQRLPNLLTPIRQILGEAPLQHFPLQSPRSFPEICFDQPWPREQPSCAFAGAFDSDCSFGSIAKSVVYPSRTFICKDEERSSDAQQQDCACSAPSPFPPCGVSPAMLCSKSGDTGGGGPLVASEHFGLSACEAFSLQRSVFPTAKPSVPSPPGSSSSHSHPSSPPPPPVPSCVQQAPPSSQPMSVPPPVFLSGPRPANGAGSSSSAPPDATAPQSVVLPPYCPALNCGGSLHIFRLCCSRPQGSCGCMRSSVAVPSPHISCDGSGGHHPSVAELQQGAPHSRPLQPVPPQPVLSLQAPVLPMQSYFPRQRMQQQQQQQQQPQMVIPVHLHGNSLPVPSLPSLQTSLISTGPPQTQDTPSSSSSASAQPPQQQQQPHHHHHHHHHPPSLQSLLPAFQDPMQDSLVAALPPPPPFPHKCREDPPPPQRTEKASSVLCMYSDFSSSSLLALSSTQEGASSNSSCGSACSSLGSRGEAPRGFGISSLCRGCQTSLAPPLALSGSQSEALMFGGQGGLGSGTSNCCSRQEEGSSAASWHCLFDRSTAASTDSTGTGLCSVRERTSATSALRCDAPEANVKCEAQSSHPSDDDDDDDSFCCSSQAPSRDAPPPHPPPPSAPPSAPPPSAHPPAPSAFPFEMGLPGSCVSSNAATAPTADAECKALCSNVASSASTAVAVNTTAAQEAAASGALTSALRREEAPTTGENAATANGDESCRMQATGRTCKMREGGQTHRVAVAPLQRNIGTKFSVGSRTFSRIYRPSASSLEIRWREGFRLPLGKEGRDKLIKCMRMVHKQNPDLCRQSLEEKGICFSRLAHATVEQLWKIAYQWGLFEYALRLSQKTGKCSGQAKGRRQMRQKSTSDVRNEETTNTATADAPPVYDH